MSLIDNYIPSDYYDVVSIRVKTDNPLTAESVFERMFCSFPRPVAMLMNLRNAIVKPLGLKGGGSFRDLVTERNEEEILLCKNDSHLCFWVGIRCTLPEDGRQDISVTTVVKYNNFLGRLYFAGIWIFHKILVKRLLCRAVRK